MKLLVMSGGRHPYEETTPILRDFLSAAGHQVTVSDDASLLTHAADMDAYNALVFNTRRENLPDFGDLTLTAAEQDGMKAFIRSGKGFLCLHIATCMPAAWPEYHEITGGGWMTGTSFHPPYGEFTVTISAPAHPVVRNLSNFKIHDELYMGLAFRDDNDVFITADAAGGTYPWGPQRQPTAMPGGTFPLGWTRQYGRGKVVVLLLGHNGKSFQSPGFQQIVLNGINWATAG